MVPSLAQVVSLLGTVHAHGATKQELQQLVDSLANAGNRFHFIVTGTRHPAAEPLTANRGSDPRRVQVVFIQAALSHLARLSARPDGVRPGNSEVGDAQ